MLGNNIKQIVVRDLTPQRNGEPVVSSSLRACSPAQVREREAILPYPKRSLPVTAAAVLRSLKFYSSISGGLERVCRGIRRSRRSLFLFSPNRAFRTRQQGLEVSVTKIRFGWAALRSSISSNRRQNQSARSKNAMNARGFPMHGAKDHRKRSRSTPSWGSQAERGRYGTECSQIPITVPP